MGFLRRNSIMADLATLPPPPAVAALLEAEPSLLEGGNTAAQYEDTIELLQERFADLELQMEDWGWARMVAEGDREFSRDGLDRVIAYSRVMAIKNPLIKRALQARSLYVWGQGVTVAGRDDTISELIDEFMENKGNRRAVFGHQARKLCQHTLDVDGNLFFNLFPNRMTADVAVRTIIVDEIREIIANPDDRSEPWFYRRVWTELRLNPNSGLMDMASYREAFYPDWQYQPTFRPPEMGGHPVLWDSPVYHVKVGGLQHSLFGIPETYASLDWARGFKGFLEDFASLAKSLSRLAWEMTSKRGSAKANAQRLGTTIDPGAGVNETNPSPVAGSTFVHGEGVEMKPINKSGALIDADQGKQLRLQVDAAFGLPDTIMSGDPDQGNLATAKTLDRPTELLMEDIQTLWVNVFQDLCNYVIDWHVKAPGGVLTGVITKTGPQGERIELDDETDRTIEVVFPPILEDDVVELSGAITAASATGLVPPKVTLGLWLALLDVPDADEIIDEAEKLGLLDGSARVNAGQQIMDRYRQGGDPADLLRGGGPKPAPKPQPEPQPA